MENIPNIKKYEKYEKIKKIWKNIFLFKYPYTQIISWLPLGFFQFYFPNISQTVGYKKSGLCAVKTAAKFSKRIICSGISTAISDGQIAQFISCAIRPSLRKLHIQL